MQPLKYQVQDLSLGLGLRVLCQVYIFYSFFNVRPSDFTCSLFKIRYVILKLILRSTIRNWQSIQCQTYRECINHDIHRTCGEQFLTQVWIKPGRSRTGVFCLNHSTKAPFGSLTITDNRPLLRATYVIVCFNACFTSDQQTFAVYSRSNMLWVH